MSEPTPSDALFLKRMAEARDTDRPVPLALQKWQLAEHVTSCELYTSKGIIVYLCQGPEKPRASLILAGGQMGGIGGPAGIFHDIGYVLAQVGIATVRFHPRKPGDVVACAIDMLLMARLELENNVPGVVLGGHSFGSAIVVQAARALDVGELDGLAFLAPQTAGTQGADEIVEVPSLFVHGASDGILPSDCSEDLASRIAGDPELHIIDGLGHLMVEKPAEVRDLVTNFVVRVTERPVLT